MMEGMKAFWRLMLLSFQALFGWMNPIVYVSAMIFMPMFHIIFFAMLGRFAQQSHGADWYLIGNAIQVCAYTSVFSVGSALGQDRSNGTLSLVLIAPRNKFVLFAGRSLVMIMHGIVTVVLGFFLGWAAFGLDLSAANWGGLALTIVLTTLTTGGLGLMMAALSLVVVDNTMMMNGATATLTLLSGVNIDPVLLPAPLQLVSFILPLRRGVMAARELVAGGALGDVWPLLAGEALVGAIYLVVGYLLFVIFERRARVAGTLDLY